MIFKIAGALRVLVFTVAVAAVLQSCSEDAGSGKGRVSVLVKDDPTTEFDQINITVDSIQMLGEGPDVYLTKEPTSFDLLELRNFSSLMLVNDQVPAGTYSKLRMEVSNIELVKLDSIGNVVEITIPKLPSGRIDLNPKEQITIVQGSDLVLELDIDAEKSIHIVTTGNGGYIFRPQVFVEILSDVGSSLIRLSGTALDVDAESFQLCTPNVTTTNADCRQIKTGAGTVVMDGDMIVSDYSQVQSGDTVLVFGHLDRDAQVINAVRIFDDTTKLTSFSGDFSTDVVADSAELVIAKDTSGLSAGDVISVTPLSAAALFDNDGNALDLSAINNGARAQIFGVLKPDATAPTEIRPGLIIIENM